MSHEVFGIIIVVIVIAAVFCSTIGMFASASKAPDGYKPGDAVYILTGKTIMQDGQPCRENKPGFVSPTSPESGNYWFVPSRLFLPTSTMISIIYPNGNLEWQDENNIVKSPADPSLLLCK